VEKDLPNPELFKVETTIDVRWSDMDVLRHVNNARYLTFCESANFEWFAKVAPGQGILDVPAYPVLARAECDFLASVTYPASLKILTRAIRVGRSSICLEHFIRDAAGTKDFSLVHLTLVFIDRETHKAVSIPEDVRANIRELDGL
jgi:acyl-CoA thioester hydrolase